MCLWFYRQLTDFNERLNRSFNYCHLFHAQGKRITLLAGSIVFNKKSVILRQIIKSKLTNDTF